MSYLCTFGVVNQDETVICSLKKGQCKMKKGQCKILTCPIFGMWLEMIEIRKVLKDE